MADDAILILVGVRSRGLDGAVGFLLQDGAFGGLKRIGLDDFPTLPVGLRLDTAFGKPLLERTYGRSPRGGFGGLGGVDELLGFRDRSGGMLRLVRQEGFGAAAGLTVLVDAVEEGREGVVVGLGDGVEFMGVALRAAQGHAQPGGAHGVHSVEDVVDAGFLGITTAFAVGHVVALEAGRELLLGRGIRQEIARELLEGELVVRNITVERFDDPVAPRPVGARGVGLESIGVRITRSIEPPHSHAFAVVRRGEQAIDGLLVGLRRGVRQERLGLSFGGRQASQVERQPAEQGVLRRFLRQGESFGGEFLADEAIDGVALDAGLDG